MEEWTPEQLRQSMDKGKIIPAHIVKRTIDQAMELFYAEENVLVLTSPIVICGDIHGQYEDLVELFKTAEGSGDDIGQKKLKHKYLFMGDYVDRGYFSLNTLLYLLSRKIEQPDGFFMLRGNHESRQVSQQYGFRKEIITNYGDASLWTYCMSLFDLLPYAAIVDGDVFSVHGGLSPRVNLIDMISMTPRKKDIPESGRFADLVWSDPQPEIKEWQVNTRGAGYLFGANPCKRFCYQNRVRLVTRSHQLVMDGYMYYFDDGHKPPGLMLNVWSAPNYGYTSGNLASVLKLRFDGCDEYDLVKFEQAKDRLERKDDCDSQYFA